MGKLFEEVCQWKVFLRLTYQSCLHCDNFATNNKNSIKIIKDVDNNNGHDLSRIINALINVDL